MCPFDPLKVPFGTLRVPRRFCDFPKQSEGPRGGSDTKKQHLKDKDDRGTGKNVIIYKTSGGKDLCKDFQFNRCKGGKDCSKGQHKCGGVMPGSEGKVCNMPGHSGIDCKRCKKGSA